MASTYSANLKIELIGTGEQSGTWGSTTNTNLGTALEEAIVGRATATFATDADLTLTLTNTNATQIARAFALRLESSVSLTATRNLIVPAINKPYIINNQTTGGQSIVVKNATGSGVTIPNGKRVAVYNNGTDVLTTIDYFPTLSVGGTTIPAGKTLVDTDSSQTLTNKTVALGSNTVSGTIAQFNTALTDADFATLAGTETLTNKTLTSPSISGATLTDGTANGVLYLNGSKAVSSGNALVFDGTNLGLGVTPSAWHSAVKVFQFSPYGGLWAQSNGSSNLAFNVRESAANTFTYLVSDDASLFRVNTSGGFDWLTAPPGTAGNPISFTQAMTLDASGNLGIGTSSPQARISAGTGTGKKILAFDAGAGSAQSGIGVDMTGEANQIALFGGLNGSSGTMISFGHLNTGTNAYTEKARIDSSGNLLVGRTNPAFNNTSGCILTPDGSLASEGNNLLLQLNKTSLASTATLISFNYQLSGVGTVATNGTSTAYNTSSDYRLKHDIAPMQNALQRVAALKPVTYKWNADNSDGEGFIAHELAEVCPQAVTGEKDAVDADGKPVYQGIDTSFLVATLTAAIQEQQAIITELRSRIEALESI